MLSSYYTVKQGGTHEINIQKSRFIGHIARVSSEEEAQSFIQSIKKKYHDATHNCTAYLIGEHDQIQKANDDGEPSGTAGIPMLEVLKKLSLKNTVIVVTRYFGGIKLGAGGLIRAYSRATSETIKTIGIVKCELMQIVSVVIDYQQHGKIENHLHQNGFIIEEVTFLEKVTLRVLVPLQDLESFKTDLVNITSNQIDLQVKGEKFIETDIPSM